LIHDFSYIKNKSTAQETERRSVPAGLTNETTNILLDDL